MLVTAKISAGVLSECGLVVPEAAGMLDAKVQELVNGLRSHERIMDHQNDAYAL
jgi:hypothetical protein